MKEGDIGRGIQIALTRFGARVFRNETGAYEGPNGQWVSYGLCLGSSDLVGWTHTGRFLAIEVKTWRGLKEFNRPGKCLKQKNFLSQVNNIGGVGFVTDSIENAIKQYQEKTI